MCQLVLVHACGLQILPHQRRRGSDRRRGHGGAGSNSKIIPIVRREYIAANTGDLRLQGETIGGTPRGEAGHFTSGPRRIPEIVHPQQTPLRVLLQHPLILVPVSRCDGYIELSQFIAIFFPIRWSRIIEQDSCCLCRRRCRDDLVGIAAFKGDKYQLPLGLLKRVRKQQHFRYQSVPESHALRCILILRIAQILPHIKARIVPAD